MKPKLTKVQRRIGRQIRELFARGEPLNICAVKRNHPDLMTAVYAVKPFWGWKRALEAAGIDYSKIKVQLEPYVECRICGEELVHLSTHINVKHGVDKDDYHIDYPGASLVSEECRARQSRMKSRVMKHWEPLWTPEYVMDRIVEFRRSNLPINSSWIFRNEVHFCSAATRYIGNWSAALRAVGIDPDAVHRECIWRYPSKEKVIEAIRERRKRGLRLGSSTICKAGDSKTRDTALRHAGKALFGSWRTALAEAGIDFPRLWKMEHRARRRYADRQSVVSEIQRRRAAGLAVHRNGVLKGEHRDIALEISGIEYFGSWGAALKAAGLLPRDIAVAKPARYPDGKAVVREFKRLAKRGTVLSYSAIVKRGRRNQALWKAARKFFGSWNGGVAAAGLANAKVREEIAAERARYPDEQAVIREIRRRRRSGLEVDASTLFKGRSADCALKNRGFELFGSWRAVLKAAGLDPGVIATEFSKAHPRYPDGKAVVREFKRLASMGMPLNVREVVSRGPKDQTLWLSAKRFFGSWNAALKASGFDPVQVHRATWARVRRFPDKKEVIREIERRWRANLPVDCRSIRKGPHRDITLYKTAIALFPSWPDALKAAGFDPDTVQRRSRGNAK